MFEELPADERERIQHEIEAVQSELEAIMREVPQWEREHRDAAAGAQSRDHRLCDRPSDRGAARRLSPTCPRSRIISMRSSATSRKTSTISCRRPPPEARRRRRRQPDRPGASRTARFRRYQVNVIVDNGAQQGAPVVYEDNPTHQTLVGRVEHLARFGALVTDFNLLVAGALHRANGGYLILDAQKLLTGNFGWAVAEAGAECRPDPHRNAWNSC